MSPHIFLIPDLISYSVRTIVDYEQERSITHELPCTMITVEVREQSKSHAIELTLIKSVLRLSLKIIEFKVLSVYE